MWALGLSTTLAALGLFLDMFSANKRREHAKKECLERTYNPPACQAHICVECGSR